MPWPNLAGLRARGLLWMLTLSLVLGGIGLALLTLQLREHHEQAERRALGGDVQRVNLLLADLLESRARAAREWSHWSEMRDFALGKSPDFAAENLSAGSIRTSGLSALAVLDLRGTPLWTMVADAQHELRLPPASDALGAWLRMRGDGRCGLVRWPALGSEYQVLCRLPVFNSSGEGEPAGTVLSWEPLTDAHIARLARLGNLPFRIEPLPKGDPGAERLQLDGLVVDWQRGEGSHRLRWELNDVRGQSLAALVLDWPRQQQAEARSLLQRVQLLWLLTTLLLTGALALLIDLRVVRRLMRLQKQMRGVRESARWQDRLRVNGDDEIAHLADEGNHLLTRIEGMVQDLEQRALTDALTGLSNRRAFDQAFAQALARRRGGGGPLVLALIDVDHFKRFNDEHGHAAGDDALRTLAKALRQGARRAGDTLFRFGGEEFAWLIEGAERDAAHRLLEQLRERVAALPVEPPLAAPLRVSIGATLVSTDDGGAALFERADAALYDAKAGGRNRVAWR